MKKRGFEIVSRYDKQQIQLPQRQTQFAAGYDLQAAEDFLVPSIWRSGALPTPAALKPVLVPTGIKVFYLQMKYYYWLAALAVL